jgi:hypothetical protein
MLTQFCLLIGMGLTDTWITLRWSLKQDPTLTTIIDHNL